MIDFAQSELLSSTERKVAFGGLGLLLLGLIVIGGFKIYQWQWHQASQKFTTKIDCMKETGNQCAYLRCDAGCMFSSEGWEPVSGRSFDSSSQLLFQKIEKGGLCSFGSGACTATTTVYFDGHITKNSSTVGSVSKSVVDEIAERIKNIRTEDDCSFNKMSDVGVKYRFPHTTIPSNGSMPTYRCSEFEGIERTIDRQINEASTSSDQTKNNQKESENEPSQRVDTHFISYPDVSISEKENGRREYELTSGVANKIPESEDKRQSFREKLSDITGQFDTSYYKLVKVYDDGQKESVPLKMRYCPPGTDVCRGTTKKVDTVTDQSARADEQPIEMTSAIKRLKLTAGGEVVDSMERPDSPLQVTSFKVNNPDESQTRSPLSTSIVAEENRDSNDAVGATSSQSDDQKSDSNENKKVHVRVKSSETNNINGSLRYVRRPDEWQLATIFERDNATSTVDFDYKVSQDRISSEFKNIDFKAEFTDGFYFVEAQKDNLVTMERQPPEFELALARYPYSVPRSSTSTSKVYLHDSFTIKMHDFEDPLLGRSDTVPDDKYRVNWKSDTLPLDKIANTVNSENYTALKIDIKPDEGNNRSLMGQHSVKLEVTDKEDEISKEKTITFEITSIAEACSSEDVLGPFIGCPRTVPAEQTD